MEEKKALRTRLASAACSPYRFVIAAAVLAAAFSLMPSAGEAPIYAGGMPDGAQATPEQAPAGADLSARTQQGCMLHRTVCYVPCGHSVQRREALPPALIGLSRGALDAQIGSVLPGAKVTGFCAQEVDVSLDMPIPCPLHWVVKMGGNGRIQVLQNLTGEALETVRESEAALDFLPQKTQAQLLEGMMFDDVQALESFLESLDS